MGALDWEVVDAPEANVHATSPDGRVYVGWLPEDATAWQRDIIWQIRVQPADGEAWIQEFGLYTPTEAVAGFLAALVTHSPADH
ncbi:MULTISPECIES: DUF317 domain-containing protein [Streptomyces]|uniref:DUF317 domain-containing protein n=1 Tax=Streptomyces glycanivorans TaxID=3033808 RepID=A0ABY9JPZ7_9ACTN|nr:MULTISPECIES: DUF317 domain-containing protein [unclassified Streptomyces]WSQ82251.1 DUF317 domain-containing protein [Streptomyces sp. NBC_01213]TXS19718.1 DUF317 domain-containing protein [Streptomyces sp. wa22]WLQ68874.1 DUF317 domain-containing protein [Streptomyces sp. Alt3]WSQ89573.1 DUF317 domain-containing protein [Streptomyces sp. NBC_01212]WSR52927.1 DUF317 domain-containing protein [Streptomyces sp. NBC_01201]